MTVYFSVEDIPHSFPASVVTIGKFDGLHIGHRKLLTQMRQIALNQKLQTVVFTFDRNPLELLAPDTALQALVGSTRKVELLRQADVDHVVMIPFDEKFAAHSAEYFVREILKNKLNAHTLVLGKDFRFGHQGRGNIALLEQMASECEFVVEVVDDVQQHEGIRVSSTYIRSLLDVGDVEQATDLLALFPSVRGEVVRGAQRGRDWGFPTANLSPHPEGYVPCDGVYAGWLIDDGVRYRAAISIGTNPTFGEERRHVEAYVLEKQIDLYGHVVTIEFAKYMRPMIAFVRLEELVQQIRQDVVNIAAFLDRTRDECTSVIQEGDDS